MLAPMHRIYLVQVIDPKSSREDSVRVEAASEDAAKSVLSHMNMIVGQARLAEVYPPRPTGRRISDLPLMFAGLLLALMFFHSCKAHTDPSFALREFESVTGHRFKADNAYGATANAAELLVESSHRLEFIVIGCAAAIAVASIRYRRE